MDEETDETETFNKFMVGCNGEDIVFLKAVPQRLSKRDALNLAAWIVALADPEFDQLPILLDKIQNS